MYFKPDKRADNSRRHHWFPSFFFVFVRFSGLFFKPMVTSGIVRLFSQLITTKSNANTLDASCKRSFAVHPNNTLTSALCPLTLSYHMQPFPVVWYELTNQETYTSSELLKTDSIRRTMIYCIFPPYL